MPATPFELLIADRVRVDARTACWRWTGAKDRNGYARLGAAMLHRVMYADLRELPILSVLPLDNLCGYRDCIHPLHWIEREVPNSAAVDWPGDALDAAVSRAEHPI